MMQERKPKSWLLALGSTFGLLSVHLLAIVLMLLVMRWIVDSGSLFRFSDTKLSVPSEIGFGISQFFVDYWYALITIVVIDMVVLYLLGRLPLILRWIRTLYHQVATSMILLFTGVLVCLAFPPLWKLLESLKDAS